MPRGIDRRRIFGDDRAHEPLAVDDKGEVAIRGEVHAVVRQSVMNRARIQVSRRGANRLACTNLYRHVSSRSRGLQGLVWPNVAVQPVTADTAAAARQLRPR